jgi:hypothetical protein
LALVVGGADTSRPGTSAETARLHAVSLGEDEHGAIERGFMVYDTPFAWRHFAAEKRHNWPAKVA